MSLSRRSLILSAPATIVAVSPALTRPIGLIRMEAGTFHAGGTSEDPYQDYRGRVGMRVVFEDGSAFKWATYPVEALVASNVRKTDVRSVEVCVWSANYMRAITEIPYDVSVAKSIVELKRQKD